MTTTNQPQPVTPPVVQVRCPVCHGTGWKETHVDDLGHGHGWKCAHCGGCGHIWVEVETQ